MSNEARIEATAKNIEGKIQEVVGDITGDPATKAEGQRKQVEAEAQHVKENIKDNLKAKVDAV